MTAEVRSFRAVVGNNKNKGRGREGCSAGKGTQACFVPGKDDDVAMRSSRLLNCS